MEKQFLSNAEFIDHIRAVVMNDKALNQMFTNNAATYNMGGFSKDDLAACIFIDKETIKARVQDFWPWLEINDYDLFHALMQIMWEFVAEGE